MYIHIDIDNIKILVLILIFFVCPHFVRGYLNKRWQKPLLVRLLTNVTPVTEVAGRKPEREGFV